MFLISRENDCKLTISWVGGETAVVKVILVKAGVAPEVAGQVRVATIVVVTQTMVRIPVNSDSVNCSVELRPVDTLETRVSGAEPSSVESAVCVIEH